MDDQIHPAGRLNDDPIYEVDEADGIEPELKPLGAGDINGLRQRMKHAKQERKAANEAKKAATSRLKTAQRKDEARRVERGEGPASFAESARSFAELIGAIARGSAKIATSAVDALSELPEVVSLVIVAAVVVVFFWSANGDAITSGISGICSSATNLWDKYVTQPAEHNANKTPVTVNKTSLRNAVSIGKLVNATVPYEGLAVKTNDKGEEICHIYYETSIFAYVNTNEIDFAIDEENKTVTPSLPDQQIEVDIPSAGSISYFEDNPGVQLDEALSLCEADAKADAADNQTLITCGQASLRKTIDALISPILDGSGYRISW